MKCGEAERCIRVERGSVSERRPRSLNTAIVRVWVCDVGLGAAQHTLSWYGVLQSKCVAMWRVLEHCDAVTVTDSHIMLTESKPGHATSPITTSAHTHCDTAVTAPHRLVTFVTINHHACIHVRFADLFARCGGLRWLRLVERRCRTDLLGSRLANRRLRPLSPGILASHHTSPSNSV